MSRRRSITIAVLVWLILVCLYAYYYVKTVLTLPDLEEGYVRDWQFQLLMFSIFRLPILLLILVIVIFVQIKVIKNK